MYGKGLGGPAQLKNILQSGLSRTTGQQCFLDGAFPFPHKVPTVYCRLSTIGLGPIFCLLDDLIPSPSRPSNLRTPQQRPLPQTPPRLVLLCVQSIISWPITASSAHFRADAGLPASFGLGPLGCDPPSQNHLIPFHPPLARQRRAPGTPAPIVCAP